MEAVFISLMALVVLLSGWVGLVVLYKLFRADNGADNGAANGTTPR
jgi:hypothetical protein